MKKISTLLLAILVGFGGFAQIAAWDFFGQSSPATFDATTYDVNLSPSMKSMTRGAGAALSAASNSFRSIGFKNDGIAVTNTDYYQITLTTINLYKLSLSSIDARVAGTTSYAATPGASNQFAYSLDGTNFTLIGSPLSQTTGSGANPLPSINLSGISDLQNVPFGTTVTLRFYASGQTATGGWGFNSPVAGQNGLAISGSLTPSIVANLGVQEFTATKNQNNAALNWTIGCDGASINMELQRSTNGIDFNSIYSENATKERCNSPFSYTDAQTAKGVNYYRIKVTSIDGRVRYSKITSINIGNVAAIKVVPTIATSSVQVYYEAPSAGTANWLVYDMNGRVVITQNTNLAKGQNTINFNVAGLAKGQYQIVGITAAGKTEALKIVKQ